MHSKIKPPPGKGVRKIKLEDIAPDAEIYINKPVYNLADVVRGKTVIDIGCGYGRNRKLVEDAGGTWVGVEPFEGGAHTIIASAEELPFDDGVFDVAIMDAVLEHIPDVGKAFSEVARVIKKDGLFVGYVAFMECFHEISYSHLSFKALEHYASQNGMTLLKIGGGHRFGIDYHLRVLFYPLPFNFMRRVIASGIRNLIRFKSVFIYFIMRLRRKTAHRTAYEKAALYYKVECLRQSNGFTYVIRKAS